MNRLKILQLFSLLVFTLTSYSQEFDKIEFEINPTRWGRFQKFVVDNQNNQITFYLDQNIETQSWKFIEHVSLPDSIIDVFNEQLRSINVEDLPDSIPQRCCDGSIKKNNTVSKWNYFKEIIYMGQ